jgi:high-affinity iron transporter
LSLQAFLLTFGDGLEAFFVIAAAMAFLRKTHQWALASAITWGVAVSVVTSLAGAWAFSRSDNQPLWEGRLALAAAAAVVGLAVYMWRTRRLLAHAAVRESARRSNGGAALAFFFFTVLVLTREGMHTVLLIGTFVVQIRVPELTLGVLSGLVGAGMLAWVWARYGLRLRVAVFAPMTALILAAAMTQLVSEALQNLAGADAPAPSEQIDFGPER